MRKFDLLLRHWGGEGRGNGAGFFSLGRNLFLGLSYLHVFKNMLKNSIHYKYKKNDSDKTFSYSRIPNTLQKWRLKY
jgi:hypothetical protein